jgi:hypothetical protein
MVSINLRSISTLIGVFLLHAIIGTIHTFPSLSKYFFSYLIELNQETFTHEFIELYLYILNSTHNIFLPIGVILIQKNYLNSSVIIGISLLLKLIVTASFIFFPQFHIILIALLIESIVCGLAYMPGLICVWKYFPNYKGFVTGIALDGFGVTRMMYKYIAIYLINSNDIPPLPMRDRYPKEINENFKSFLKKSEIFFCFLSALTVFLIYPFEEVKEEEKTKLVLLKKNKSIEKLNKAFKKSKIHSYSSSNLKSAVSDEDSFVTFLSSYYKNESDTSSDNEKITEKKKEESLRTLITSQPFLQLTFIFFFSMMFCSIELFIIKKLGKMHRHSEETISNGTLLWKITNAFYFSVWGYLLDKYKFKNLFIVILIIEIAISSSCYFICIYKWGFLLYTFLGALVNSANLVLSPAIFVIIFGIDRGSLLFAISSNLFNTYYFLRPLINNFVSLRIYYLIFYLIITLCAVLSLIIVCFFIEKPYVDKETNNLPYMELDEFDLTDTDA